ncbi:MAG TPA: hypothetical protein VGA20_05310 [Gemmatimonadales bacterium]
MRTSVFLLLLVACNPFTTRPDFVPLPQAPVAYLDARRDVVTREVTAWLQAESLLVVRSEPGDGYVETAWYDPVTRRSLAQDRDPPHAARTFRVRCWADPDVPNATRLTVEVVSHPFYDPSRTARDLEVLVPDDHEGKKLAERLIEAMKQKFGVPPERQEPTAAPSTTPPTPGPRSPSAPGPATRPGRGRLGAAS